MARKRAFGSDVRARVFDLVAAGLRPADIPARLRMDGVNPPPSESWVRKVLDEGTGSISSPASKAPAAEVVTDAPEAEASSSAPLAGGVAATVVPLLERNLAALEKLTELAVEDEDPGRFGQLMRAQNAIVANLVRLTPPAPPDREEAPDMVAAAAKCREKLHAFLERKLNGGDP